MDNTGKRHFVFSIIEGSAGAPSLFSAFPVLRTRMKRECMIKISVLFEYEGTCSLADCQCIIASPASKGKEEH